MSEPLRPPSAATIAALRDVAERRLAPDEFRAWVEAPMSDREREETIELIAWFTRRYPTPAARLAYARAAAARWTAAMPGRKP